MKEEGIGVETVSYNSLYSLTSLSWISILPFVSVSFQPLPRTLLTEIEPYCMIIQKSSYLRTALVSHGLSDPGNNRESGESPEQYPLL